MNLTLSVFDIYLIASSVISSASIFAALFPKSSEETNKFIAIARQILDIFAFNFGFAKNHSDVAPTNVDK